MTKSEIYNYIKKYKWTTNPSDTSNFANFIDSSKVPDTQCTRYIRTKEIPQYMTEEIYKSCGIDMKMKEKIDEVNDTILEVCETLVKEDIFNNLPNIPKNISLKDIHTKVGVTNNRIVLGIRMDAEYKPRYSDKAIPTTGISVYSNYKHERLSSNKQKLMKEVHKKIEELRSSSVN